MDRYTKPFINEAVLFTYFGYDNDYAKQHFVKSIGEGKYELLPNFISQRLVETYFKTLPNDDWHCKMQQGLYNLISNVVLFKGDEPHTYHFRFNMEELCPFKI